jgi:hypothetical protein
MTPVAILWTVSVVPLVQASQSLFALSGPQFLRPLGYHPFLHGTFSHVFVRRCRVVRGASPPQDSCAGVGARQLFFGSTTAHVHLHVGLERASSLRGVVRGASPPQDSCAGVGIRQLFSGESSPHTPRPCASTMEKTRVKPSTPLLHPTTPPHHPPAPTNHPPSPPTPRHHPYHSHRQHHTPPPTSPPPLGLGPVTVSSQCMPPGV